MGERCGGMSLGKQEYRQHEINTSQPEICAQCR